MTSAVIANNHNIGCASNKKAKKATAEPKIAEATAVVESAPSPPQVAEKTSSAAKKKNKKNKNKAAAAAAVAAGLAATNCNGVVGEATDVLAPKQQGPVNAKKDKNLSNALEKNKESSALPDKVVWLPVACFNS